MWTYWAMFLWPVFAALMPLRLTKSSQMLFWWLTGIFFSVLIGFRYQVGGDWFNYAAHMQAVASGGLSNALTFGEAGYYGMSWLVSQLGGGVLVVDLICGAIFMVGVIIFARAQPRPWLALVVAVPYLIIVVAMGYTRQSAALGFALIALVSLERQRLKPFVFWVLMGALFHKSELLLLPIAALASSRRRVWNAIWLAIIAAAGAYLSGGKSSQVLWQSYVAANYQSEGGLIRVAMNGVPALLLLIFRHRLIEDDAGRRLWCWIAIFALACLPLVFISSAAVDRVALYFIPLQLYVFGRLDGLAKQRSRRALIVLGVITYYALIEFVWLNFASHAQYWLPYHFFSL